MHVDQIYPRLQPLWTLQTLVETDVSLLVYSPLGGGTLSGKYLGDEDISNCRLKKFPGFYQRYDASLAREATLEYRKVRAA